MKKNFKFMLVALLALMGFNSASAQVNVTDELSNDAYYFEVQTVNNTAGTGTVYITKINAASDAEVELPPTFSKTIGGKAYTFDVTGIKSADPAEAAFKDQTQITKVTIPSSYEFIGSNAFYGCTNLAEIDLSDATGLKTIADQAFVTIQVTSYDFSACTKLTGFEGMPFVENIEGKNNSYVQAITMPTNTAFKTIGIALSRLPNLETQNIAATKITAIVADAFKGDAKLKTLVLPGTVKTIASNAFRGSSVETLTIDATSIQTIGSNNGDPVYGAHPGTPAVLKSLTIINELKGVIEENAFANESKLETLALSCTFGTTGQIQSGAFAALGEKITKVTLGNITDNGKNDYTIMSNAFSGTKLTEVEIGDISAPLAIAANAFQANAEATQTITKVKIGYVKTSDLAIAAHAFNFANNTCELTIGEVRSTNATNPVMGAGAFDFSAVEQPNGKKYTVTVKIGAVSAKGKNFTGGDIVVPTGYDKFTLTFTGDIEQDAFVTSTENGTLLSDNSKLNELTFKGKIAEGGITAGAFAGLANNAKVIFDTTSSLAENAVMAGAFTLGQTADANNNLTVEYKGTPDDVTVNPFAQEAFLNKAEGHQPLEADAKRTVTLTISNTALKTLISEGQISIDDPTPYENADNDIIYAVKLIVVAPAEDLSLTVYKKTGTTTSYGRWFLTAEDYPNGLIINRRGNEGMGTVTLYTTYVENDEDNEVVVINMQPIPCTDGKYVFKAEDLTVADVPGHDVVDIDNFEDYNTYFGFTDADEGYMADQAAFETAFPDGYYEDAVEAQEGVPGLVVIAKVTGTSADETEIPYEENDDDLDSNPWYTDYAVKVSDQVVTNEQLRDGSGAVQVAEDEDLYFITNPAKHNGVTAPTYDFRDDAAKNVYIDNGSFYLLAPKYDNAGARIVWLDGSEEATAIESVKTVNAEGAIFNLSGQKVNANYKGIIIKDGKKMILK